MANSNREKKHILLVEDEEDARELAAFALAEYTLVCARDFEEGGTRGDFAREWLSVFSGEVRAART